MRRALPPLRAELVARIGVALDRAADLPLSPVDAAPPVGVNEPPNQRPRILINELALPFLEHDRSRVLHNWSVLRKHAEPVNGACLHPDASGAVAPSTAEHRRTQHACHGRLDLANDVGVMRAAADAQAVAAAALADVAVTEVLTEQVEIGIGVRDGLITAAKAVDGGSVGQWLQPLLPPVGAVVADLEDAADVSATEAQREQVERHLPDRDFVHAPVSRRATTSSAVVPGAGFEPARPFGQRFLRPPCIPFHHPGFEMPV